MPDIVRKIIVISAFIASVHLSALRGGAADFDRPSDHASWWVENHGLVTADRNPLVERATRVFDRVCAAARKGSRFPKLLVVRGAGEPAALVINDGSIILSEDAVRVCYRGVPAVRGDARISFVLGHELAHLSKDEYRRDLAFVAVREHVSETPVRRSLLRQMKETDGLAWQRELQADSDGLVTMAVAGYDPWEIVGGDRNFFEEWNRLRGYGGAGDGRYPSARERGAALVAQLREIAGNTGLFSFGARLYQLGRYRDAILLFEKFREIFPDRGAFNNTGLAHYQLALRELADCDESLLSRFMLSTVLETETYGSRRGRTDSACMKNPTFLSHIREAVRNMERARDQDSAGISAGINLTSALITAGEYTAALAAADEALKISPARPEVLNNKAVALYLFGLENDIDSADTAAALLKEVTRLAPLFANAHYNMAAIQSERGRRSAASESWRAFIGLEKSGLFARMAEKKGGVEAGPAAGAKTAGTDGMISPVPLGRVEGKLNARLAGMGVRAFRIGALDVAIFTEGDTRVLAMGKNVEIVETRAPESFDRATFVHRYGEPEKTVRSTVGETLIYGRFAVDVVNNRVEKAIFNAD